MFIREVASTSVPRRRTSSGYSQQCSSPTVANLRKCPSRKPLNDLRCIYKTTTVGLSASGMSGGIPACVGRKRRTRKGRRRDSAKHSQDVAPSYRIRSAAFCYWQDRSDASSQYHVPEQSRTSRIKRAPKQSVSKPICRPGPKPRGNLGLRSSH